MRTRELGKILAPLCMILKFCIVIEFRKYATFIEVIYVFKDRVK